jgi:predicted ATPase/DNA-binding SARP family transcriptional activator/tetratricopeptide (TPR) repeat protein
LDDQPVQTDRRKAVALLAVLSLEPGAQRRERLAALFWPDFETNRAYAYLRRTLWEIHQMIGAGWLRTNRDEVALEKKGGLWVDVLEFESLAEKELAGNESGRFDRFQDLERVAALYRGDFLAGFSLRDSLEFDAWQQQRSESLRLKMQAVLERLVLLAGEAGQNQTALDYASRWVSIDALNEAAQRALIRAYARAGQRSAALRQYELCADLLRSELGVEPETETIRLVEQIRAGEFTAVSRMPLGAEREESRPIMPQPLPEYPSAFLGREAELTAIASLLAAPDCRLVTLLGTGGSGKTRLAIEVGRRNAERFTHGIGFVSLAAIREVESILPAIGRAIHLTYRLPGEEQIPTRDLRDQLFDFLREKLLLLILDNWEHLLEGAGLLSEILAAAPGIKILTTSRERLNLAEEWVFDVRGLSYPPAPTAERLESYSAYQLFVQSARRLNTSFAPDSTQQACIGELCRALDGLPLGIELAASWVRLLNCCEIAAEIRRNIDFLETSLRGVPERHRSMRAVFDQSWSLLSQSERDALMRLAVFRGGFTREAAASVAGAPLDLLAGLLDKSLVMRDSSGRYWMHEVIKQFSAQRLEENPVLAAQTRDTHSAYFLDWLISAKNWSTGERQREIMRSFDLEIENIGAACLWAVDRQRWELLIQALPVLFLFQDTSSSYRSAAEILGSSVEKIRPIFHSRPDDGKVLTVYVLLLGLYARSLLALDQIDEYRGLASEGYTLLEKLEPSESKAWALTFFVFGYFMVEQDELLVNVQRAYQWFEQAGERRGMAITLGEWANLLDQKERKTTSQEAIAKLKQAIAWMEELNDPWLRARMLNGLARVHNFHGEYLQARGYLLEALSIFEELGENWPVVDARFNLGQNATWLGEYDLAEDYFKASLSFLRNMGSGPYYGAYLDCLGYLAYLQKDFQRAKSYYEESLAVYQRSQYPAGIMMVYNNLGDIARATGDQTTAVEYYQKGIALLPEDGEYWGHSIIVKNLGYALLENGELEQAENCLRDAQRYARLIERVPDILEIDMVGARLFALRGDLRRALEILAMVSSHPAATQVVRDEAGHLLDELRAELPSGEVLAALEQGARLQPGCAFQLDLDTE